jgi:uncharacterized caspase-like protein/WD40 repeat protein
MTNLSTSIWYVSACASTAALLACAIAAPLYSQVAPDAATTIQKPELFVQGGAITGMTKGATACSPDGRWYVTGDGAVWQLWSVELRTELRRWSPLPPGIVANLAVAADNKTILALQPSVMTRPVFGVQGVIPSSTLTTRLSMVDAATGRWQRDLVLPDAPFAISANPSEMAVAVLDTYANAVDVRSLADGKALFSATVATEPPPGSVSINSRVFFSADGKLLFVVNPEHLVAWEWHGGRKVLDFDAHAAHAPDLDRQVPVNYRNKSVSTAAEEHYDNLLNAALSRDGKEIVACSKDEVTLFTVDGRSGAFRSRPTAKAEANRLFSGCGYVPGGRYYLSLYDPNTNLPTGTTLVDRKSGERTQLTLDIDAVFQIPQSDLSLIRTGTEATLLSETGVTSPTPPPPISSFHPSFTTGNAQLLWRTTKDFPLAWDLRTGEADLLRTMHVSGYALSTSGDGARIAYEESVDRALKDHVAVSDALSGTVVARFPNEILSSMYEPSLDMHGSVLAMLTSDTRLEVYRLPDKKIVFSLDFAKGETKQMKTALSPHGDLLVVSMPTGVAVYELASARKVAVIPVNSEDGITWEIPIQFSPDGAWLALARQGNAMRLISTKNWKDEKHLSPVLDMPFSFSPDSKRIVYAQMGTADPDTTKISWMSVGAGVVVDEIATGKRLYAIPSAGVDIYNWPAFSKDGKILAIETGVGMQLLNAGTGELLATLYVFDGGSFYDWLVVTPNGLFDGSPGAWRRVNWRFNGNAFDVAPVESFFREFYHPGLLAEVIAGKNPTAPADISSVDRRQPFVTLKSDQGQGEINQDHVHLDLDVTESRAMSSGAAPGPGACDLRLFRNGTLVKIWRGDMKLDRDGHAHLTADVRIVEGENNFTAYAFSQANIKSPDAMLSLTGSEKLHKEGTAYILTVGINRYAADSEAEPVNLSYAEADANDFADIFSKDQTALQQFGNIKTIRLLSTDATKANIFGALSLMAGGSRDSLTDAQRILFKDIDPVQPEDGVFLFFAGHGGASAKHFYLLPTDFNPHTHVTSPESEAISEEMLGSALENISPARSFLVIDACQSGKALDNNGMAAGPMNNTGLAQVAYEKGLYILAASQATEDAMEAPQLAGGHGFLTYALVEEGLKTSKAAQDGIVELRPWFEYASRRVPQLPGMLQHGRTSSAVTAQPAENPTDELTQHPRVFYRREPETSPFIVAKPRSPSSPLRSPD